MKSPTSLQRPVLPAVLPLAILTLALTSASRGVNARELAPNPELDQGESAPLHWTLSAAPGEWVGRQILQVTGNGESSNYWSCRVTAIQSGELYRFRFRARGLDGAGTAIAGPDVANRDFRGLSKEWQWYDYVFRAPDGVDGATLRLGQWHHTGTIQFDAVQVRPVVPVHSSIGGLHLGEGESIRDGRYVFRASYGHRGSNFHRTLERATAAFNSDRWTFSGGHEVIYRLHVPGCRQRSGTLRFAVNYHVRGGCVAEARRDGESAWRPLVSQDEVGDASATLPRDVTPAETIFVRLRGTRADSSFQVNRIEFEAELDGEAREGDGSTRFASVDGSLGDLAIQEITLQERPGSGHRAIRLDVTNRGAGRESLALSGRVTRAGMPSTELPLQRVTVSPGGRANLVTAFPLRQPGRHELALRLQIDNGEAMAIALDLDLPDYYRADYGRRLAADDGASVLWWCDATRKVPPGRPPPGRPDTTSAAELTAAKDDFEAVQIVVHALQELEGLTATATPLSGPGDAVIPASRVQILRVAYHLVSHPTDSTGVPGLWPDALPPLTRPIDIQARTNQPLWVLVHVPRDAIAGDYAGRVSLRARGWSREVPLRLHVWDFCLPERNHLETAFGLSTGDIFRYHRLRNENDKRRVLELYLKSFSEHRISPYDPAPLDPIRVEFLPEAQPPRAKLDFTAFDRAMEKAVREYGFTNFRLGIQGMGGGTFHARHPPSIGRFGEETSEYQSMFASYVQGLEAHLRSKDWLSMAYVYWFDEPAPRDYEFVISGMKRLNGTAPGLQRMLTEEPGDELAGSVDIWCPVTYNYDHEEAEKRRAQGERVWWYVCTGPKAPYCTLFIDHPATELRVWLWQTWKYDVAGILVWRANYWTSSAAFPDQPQDPYEDPMGYVSGYSTPRGVRRFWGNGDGRFIYPPESTVAKDASGSDPILEPPVSSIRWEMLREGIEDWEFFWLLRSLLDARGDRIPADERHRLKRLLDVPSSITAGMTTFTTDPTPLYARRAEIAEAIERLQD